MATNTHGEVRGSGRVRSWADLNQGIERGRDLQALALSQAVTRAATTVARLARTLLLGRLRASRRGDTRMLLGLSDRMLADIGLQRADVQGMAYGVIPMPVVPGEREQGAGAAILTLPERRCRQMAAVSAAA